MCCVVCALCSVLCVVCAVGCVLCAVLCVVCCALYGVCCGVCCVVCGVCRVLCGVLLCAVSCVAPTPTYHASNSNSRSASPYPRQGQDASGRSGQQHTEENSYTEMDSRRDCERDSAVQIVSDGVSLPAHHGADCDSDSHKQHTQVHLLLFCCFCLPAVCLLSVCSTPSISLDPYIPVYHPSSACLFVYQPVCVVGRTYR